MTVIVYHTVTVTLIARHHCYCYFGLLVTVATANVFIVNRHLLLSRYRLLPFEPFAIGYYILPLLLRCLFTYQPVTVTVYC
jgi:hypothetical protein